MSGQAPNQDWSGKLAITGTGLVTPVGFKAEPSLAALRASISRLSRIEHFEIEVDEDEYEAVIGAEVSELTQGRLGPERLLAMMKPAFKEAIESSGIQPADRLGVYIGTSGSRPAERILNYDEANKENLLNVMPEGYQVHRAKLIQAGRASVLRAIRAAATALEENLVDAAIIGAVDSWVTPIGLNWLLDNKRLKDYPRKTGTIPAEAAGFVVLELPERAQKRKAPVHALVTRSAGRQESIKWGEATNAVPLSQCVQSVAAGIHEDDALVISDLCGERYRAIEWMMAIPKAMWRCENMRHWNPADCIGDSGAAMGAVSLAWAAEALRKNYAHCRNILIWGASDEGAREAAIVTAVEG
jgi:3-oxoacyl-[acyl-carrier-protein] synthase-1